MIEPLQSFSYTLYSSKGAPVQQGGSPPTDNPGVSSVEGDTYEKTTSLPSEGYTLESLVTPKFTQESLITELKAEDEERMNYLTSIVNELLGQWNKADELDPIEFWSKFKDKNLTITPEQIKKAKQDISEDGYYGVENTAQRIYNFAKALAGDDQEKMKEMKENFTKSIETAQGYWGDDLPEICQQTIARVYELFGGEV